MGVITWATKPAGSCVTPIAAIFFALLLCLVVALLLLVWYAYATCAGLLLGLRPDGLLACGTCCILFYLLNQTRQALCELLHQRATAMLLLSTVQL
jgi:hypothetical protein